MKNLSYLISVSMTAALLSSCSFNFELTSQKTALENQIMGSYKELDDEVLLMASVRGVGTDGQTKETKVQSDAAKLATDAKQNQSFNRDDVDEYKEKQLLGEQRNGDLAILPKGKGLIDTASDADLKFIRYLVAQENKDREVIVKRIVATNAKLTEKDIVEAKRVYRKALIDDSPFGTWVESDAGVWERKVDQKKTVGDAANSEKAKL